MEGLLNDRDRRRYPRMVINLPLEYQNMDDSNLRGAMVVNAGNGGFLIESTRDIPVGTKLKVTLLFSVEFELANFEAIAKVVWKEHSSRKNSEGNQVWEGYRYGLEFIQVLDEDRRKLNLLLGGFEFEEIFSSLTSQL